MLAKPASAHRFHSRRRDRIHPVMGRFIFAVSQPRALQHPPVPAMTCRIMLALTAAGHAASAEVEKGDLGFMSFSVHFSNDEKTAQEKPAQIRIPNHLKVSCQKTDACRSASRRERGFVCGSNFSHDDRLGSCIEYYRLYRGMVQGERGGHLL